MDSNEHEFASPEVGVLEFRILDSCPLVLLSMKVLPSCANFQAAKVTSWSVLARRAASSAWKDLSSKRQGRGARRRQAPYSARRAAPFPFATGSRTAQGFGCGSAALSSFVVELNSYYATTETSETIESRNRLATALENVMDDINRFLAAKRPKIRRKIPAAFVLCLLRLFVAK